MSNEAFLIIFLILIALMTLVPLLLRRFKIPVVIALLITGMLIGKIGIDLIGHVAPLLAFLGCTLISYIASHIFVLWLYP